MSRQIILGSLILALLGVSERAAAQPWTGERWVRGRPSRVDGELALYTRNNEWAFAPSARAMFRVIDSRPALPRGFIVDLDFAWRAIGVAGPADTFRPGNPYAGVRFGWRDPVFRFRVGVGTTAPLTNAIENGAGDLRAYQLAQAMHGLWDAWLMEPEIQPLVFRADLEIHGRGFLFGADAGFGVAMPLRRAGGGDTQVAFQTGAYGAFLPIPELAFGARLQLFYASTWRIGFGGLDDAELALVPFVRLDLLPAFFEVRLVMNLDEPFGFAFDDGVWSVAFSAGARF